MAAGWPGLVKLRRLVDLGLVGQGRGAAVLELGGLVPTNFEGWTVFVQETGQTGNRVKPEFGLEIPLFPWGPLRGKAEIGGGNAETLTC
jgi:hypothetical protein